MKLGGCLFLLFLTVSAGGAKLEDRFAPFEGINVHYRTGGDGEGALVFVHGWACNAEFWRRQAEGFPGRRVIIVDLPGHGLSDKPRTDYTLDYFARSIAAVMRDAKVERAVLVGHSMGAPVVARFYGLYPKGTLGLVIVDGAMRPFMPKEAMERTIVDLRAGYRAAAPPMIDSWLTGVKGAKLRGEIRTGMLATQDHVGIGAFQAMADEKAYERGPIGAPVLAVLAKSHGWSADDEAFLRSLAPNLRLLTWDAVSHFLMMEKPTEFNKLLRQYLLTNNLLAGKIKKP